MEEYDLLIEKAIIVEGSGKKAYKGSIGVKEDKIVALGSVKGSGKKVVDAGGLTAIPGFIDAHSHADLNLLFYPKCDNYVMQGVTTFVGGHCGLSPAPMGDMIEFPGSAKEYIREVLPYKYYPEKSLFPREQVNEIMKEHFGWTADWETMGDFFKVVEDRGISANYVPLVGHGTIRRLVMGEDFKRPCTKNERQLMSDAIVQAMNDGCVGLSVGLDYDPDVYADREELVEHVGVLNGYDGLFCPHSRRTGARRGIVAGKKQHDKIDGINEVIGLCRETGVGMNIAHLFTGWYITPGGGPDILEIANHKATLMVIDKALEEGLKISFDALPSTLTSPYGGANYLSCLFAPWLRQTGSREEFSKLLTLREFRDEIKDGIFSGKWFLRLIYNPNTNPLWAESILVLQHKNKDCENKSVAQIARERGTEPFDTWLDLIMEDPEAKCPIGEWYAPLDPNALYHTVFYEHPLCAVGLDTGVIDFKHESRVPPWHKPGIVQYSAFVGFVDKYVNKQKLYTLEQAVDITSTRAAKNFRLEGRGVLKEGGYADIVLMDLPNIRIAGTPLDSRQPPEGIKHVFVNGKAVVENSKHTGATPGRVLKKE
ncbi:hypothetical protein E2P71_05175 [Candidatus Bathyarchaeota archaeon]|nr:hypothetical protein E2P71_05175 [Candidatus Bathyarchaeota archaeon]